MTIGNRDIVRILGVTTAFLLALSVIYVARREFIWIGTAFFLAVALNPAVARLTRYMPGRRRGLAILSVFAMGVAVLAFVIVALAPPVVHQTGLLARNLPGYGNELVRGNSWVSQQVRHLDLQHIIKTSQDEFGKYLSSASGSVFAIARGVFSSFAAGVTILGLMVFMLIEGPGWLETFWRLVPVARRSHARLLATQMYEAVAGYVTGNLLTSLLAAVLVAIMLTIVGVPFAIPLGLLVGLFDLIPLVGATLGAIVVVTVALFTSVAAAVVMLIFFIVYQQLENHFLQPVIYGRTVQMSPLTVLVSVLIGVGVAGFIGAIVAIPVGASVQILVRDLVERRIKGSNGGS